MVNSSFIVLSMAISTLLLLSSYSTAQSPPSPSPFFPPAGSPTEAPLLSAPIGSPPSRTLAPPVSAPSPSTTIFSPPSPLVPSPPPPSPADAPLMSEPPFVEPIPGKAPGLNRFSGAGSLALGVFAAVLAM